MSAHICPCDGCSRPTHAGWGICLHHSWELERNLGDIPALVDELDLTISRQVAGGARNGSRSTTKPLPFDYNGSEAMFGLRNTLVGWIRDLEPEPSPDRDWPEDRAVAMAFWLIARIDRLRTHPAAEEAVGEIGSAVAECWRAIDRRAERVYAGSCGHAGCEEGLYAVPGRAEVTCRACGVVHLVEAKLGEIMREMWDKLLTVREIARMAAYSGDFPDTVKTENRLNKWVERGVIQGRGLDVRGRETYPFGDTLERLRAADRKVS